MSRRPSGGLAVLAGAAMVAAGGYAAFGGTTGAISMHENAHSPPYYDSPEACTMTASPDSNKGMSVTISAGGGLGRILRFEVISWGDGSAPTAVEDSNGSLTEVIHKRDPFPSIGPFAVKGAIVTEINGIASHPLTDQDCNATVSFPNQGPVTTYPIGTTH